MSVLYVLLAILFVVLFTGTGLCIILAWKARDEIVEIWKRVK